MSTLPGSVVGVGVDVAQTDRFARLLGRGAEGVWRHWFTEEEARACRLARDTPRAATLCFAVKEATYKAVGASFAAEVRWRDIEALPGAGTWRVTLHGEVARTAREAGADVLHVSTAHAGSGVMATVVATRAPSTHTNQTTNHTTDTAHREGP